MQTLIIFLIVLGVLVFVHELGHFIVARRNGCKVYEFGFGFPPRIAGFRKVDGKYRFFFGAKTEIESEDTIYSINLLPLGGFVRIKGEGGEHQDEEDSFAAKGAWPRIKILSAGVIMNFLLAMVLLSGAVWFGLPSVIEEGQSTEGYTDIKTQVLYVMPDSAAQEGGLQEGDILRQINGNTVKGVEDVKSFVQGRIGVETDVVIERGESTESIVLTPKEGNEGNAVLGISLARTGVKQYAWYESLWAGVEMTGFITFKMFEGLYTIIKNLVTSQEVGGDLAGPVGIAVITGRVAKLGFAYLLQFMALLSINLGVINILPIPALDGGRILFVLIEKIRGKKFTQKIEQRIHATGFLLLILLILVVTFKDIATYF